MSTFYLAAANAKHRRLYAGTRDDGWHVVERAGGVRKFLATYETKEELRHIASA